MRLALAPMSLLLALSLAGCGIFGSKKPLPAPMEYSISSPYDQVHTFAVAPTINLSGSRDFDPLVVSDLIYAEMQQVQGLNVLPLNKTLLAMQRLHMRSIDDPKAAQALASALGADGLVIPAVTAYDPYNPPVVGMVLQLYTVQDVIELRPAALDGHSSALRDGVRANQDGPTIVADVSVPVSASVVVTQPVSQVAAVFNATNQTVLKELQVFSRGRTQYDSALADQKFLMDSDSYMRFVAHAMIRRLMDVERTRSTDR